MVDSLFRLDGQIHLITGGAGFLGRQHAHAIARAGGVPVLLDLHEESLQSARVALAKEGAEKLDVYACDITKEGNLMQVRDQILNQHGRIDGLINNAARNPKVEREKSAVEWSRLESFPLETWHQDLAVGLTGAFLCAKIFGAVMARQKKGIILNISSDLGIIGPDQRLYRKDDLSPLEQPVKPVTYSVIKSGLLGLTRYLATYWAEDGVRVNALCPGGVEFGQPEEFITRLSQLIPLKRMAQPNEYQGAIIFLLSGASSYMTGSTVIIDGGRTTW